MGRPIPAFLDEVAEFLDETLLPELYDDYRYYDECVVRSNYDDERLNVRNVSFCELSGEEDVRRVNDVLSDGEIRLTFHFADDEPLTGSWTEILQSFSATLHVPEVAVPTALKWEASGPSGKLKADEWFDAEREYVETDVGAKNALRVAVTEQLYSVVPEFRAQSETEQISPAVLAVMYQEDSAVLEQLEPTRRT